MSGKTSVYFWLGLILSAAGGEARAALDLELVASGFERPLSLVHAGDGSDRLFVAQQAGLVYVLKEGVRLEKPFLDISDRISCCGGRGLLGLAFHPDHEANGFFFAYYTDESGDSVISRFRVSSSDPNRGRAGSEREMYRFEQPTPGHNGGDLAFGPDGYLYLASGDGSNGGDPDNSAQSLASPLGKILRFDVDGPRGVAPEDNPFVGDAAAVPEIWAYGLRNPWRISFDRDTGDFLIADVGQEIVEEVNFQPAASTGGDNYGWRLMEGSECFEPATDCDDGSLVAPVIEYRHDLGCSITGGYRYRGRRAETLRGHYVYGDFCSGTVWGAEPNRNGVWISRVLAETGLPIVTFGEAENGELYLVAFGGSVYRLVSREIFADGFESGDLASWRRRGPVVVVEPGLRGSGFGLAVSAETGTRARVLSRAPSRESRIELDFDVNLSDVDFGGGSAEVATLADGKGAHLRLELSQLSRRNFEASLWVRDAETGETLVGRTKIKARRTERLGMRWRASSTPAAADGSASLLRNGKIRGSASDLRTGNRVVNSVLLGLPAGVPAGASGLLLLDSVVLSR